MRHPQAIKHPDFLAAMRSELSDWRQWSARAVVLAHAGAAGLAIVAFTWLSEQAVHGFLGARAQWPWLPLVWTPLVTAGLVWLTIKFFPGAGGSGIPQVIAALSPQTVPRERRALVSLRLALAKIGLTSGGLLAGLAIGREGPAVQIAAGVMQHAERWLPRRSAITPHALLVAGGAAGVAAAFNAPLAGVMFAIEQLTRKVEERTSGLIITAIVLAGLVAVSVFGNATYFGVIAPRRLELAMLWPGLVLVVACGAAGGLFSRLLVTSLTGDGGRLSRWRARHPVWFAAGCGLAVAAIGIVTAGATFGAGYEYTKGLLEGENEVPVLSVTLRMIATWLAAWSGVPGGVFAPSLAIGAGIGSDVAQLLGPPGGSAVFIALGMVAFLAATTQAPITAFIIVMEMVSGHAMVLSLMAAALGASLIARTFSRPLYAALADALLSAQASRSSSGALSTAAGPESRHRQNA
jgi:H+/Cl- antiporter ClcA